MLESIFGEISQNSKQWPGHSPATGRRAWVPRLHASAGWQMITT